MPISEQVNVWRDDTVQNDQMLSQEQALAKAEETFEGFFVVPLIVDKKAS